MNFGVRHHDWDFEECVKPAVMSGRF